MSRNVEDILARMPVADKVGQLIMAYLEPEALDEKVARYRCGSLLVWGNLKEIDARGLCELSNRAQAVSLERRGLPLWLHGWSPGLGWRPDWLGRAARTAGTEQAERVAGVFGRRWRAVGLHNLPEPCLNVPLHDTGIMPAWTVSRDPDVVRRYGVALTRGATAARCGTMAQHFPAHGATPLDSHNAYPVVALDRETLMRDHLECYRACFEAGCRTICTAHLACLALDPDPDHIATTSGPILTDFLRGELGFRGVTIADAIGMYGFRKNGPPEVVCVDAVNAGCDSLCITGGGLELVRLVFEGLMRAVGEGRISGARLDEAVGRHLRFLDWLGLLGGEVAVSPEESERVLRDDGDGRLLREVVGDPDFPRNAA